MNRRERIIEVSHSILALRSQLNSLEAELDSLIAVDQSDEAQRVANRRDGSTKSLAEKVMDILVSDEHRSFSPLDVLETLGEPRKRLATVRSTLHRLVGEKRIARLSPGYFSASLDNQAGTVQPDVRNGLDEVKHAAA